MNFSVAAVITPTPVLDLQSELILSVRLDAPEITEFREFVSFR